MNYLEAQLRIWREAERVLLSTLGKVFSGWFGWLAEDRKRLDTSPPPVFELQKALRESMPLSTMSTVELARREYGLYGAVDPALELVARYYELHAHDIAKNATQDVQSRLKILVIKGIEQGAGEMQLAEMMRTAGIPFTLGRLRTIARTELTNSSTLARLKLFHDNGMGLFDYRNALDDRTTRTCRCAAGLTLDLTRAADQHIVPANHYLCRSLIVPAYGKRQGSPQDQINEVLKVRSEEFPGWDSRLNGLVSEVYRA